VQFVKVEAARLTAPRFLVFLAQRRVKLRQAGISGIGRHPFLDLRKSCTYVPFGLGTPRLRDAKLNKLLLLTVLGECAETLGKTVTGIKIPCLLKQGLGGAPVCLHNGLRPCHQRIQKSSLYGHIALILAMSFAQSL
jgi:hypothetical protein